MRAWIIAATVCMSLAGCQSAYYSAAEQVGIHKRDIMVDRVEESQEAQQEAEEQFQSALEQFSVLVNFDGGELQEVYDDLNGEYEKSVSSAEEVRERIDAVEHVAEALFDEWTSEINEYSSARLKSESQRQLDQTRQRYEDMIKAMRKAESRMDPVLVALKDNVLFLKHNLNARAIASLKTEYRAIQQDVDVLIAEMRKAIASSDAFIKSMTAQ